MEWWNNFLDTFNGKCDFLDSRPITDLQTDACASGLGAFFKGDLFYSNLLVDAQPLAYLHINYKEALCVVFSGQRWASSWYNKTVFVYCDNTAAVAMINKGSTRNPVMMTYLRDLFWLSATYNFRIRAVHIAGKLNTTADHVSRLHEASHFLSFINILQQFSSCLPFSLSAVDHMSWSCYYLLIGTFLSQ